MYGNRILRSVGLGIVAAVLVGGAQAAERPDDRAGMIGVGAAQVAEAPPDAFERAALRHASAGMIGVGAAQVAEAPPDAFERAVLRHASAGTIGVGAAQVVEAPPDAFERAVLRHASAAAPDAFERAVVRQATIAVRPDDRAGARGPGGVVPTLSPSVDPTEPSFGWSDALLGAAGILGVLLLGAAATLTIRHRGRVVLR